MALMKDQTPGNYDHLHVSPRGVPIVQPMTTSSPPTLKQIPIGRAAPRGQVGASAAEQHAEWLLDEAIMETFPASDPVAPYQPDLL